MEIIEEEKIAIAYGLIFKNTRTLDNYKSAYSTDIQHQKPLRKELIQGRFQQNYSTTNSELFVHTPQQKQGRKSFQITSESKKNCRTCWKIQKKNIKNGNYSLFRKYCWIYMYKKETFVACQAIYLFFLCQQNNHKYVLNIIENLLVCSSVSSKKMYTEIYLLIYLSLWNSEYFFMVTNFYFILLSIFYSIFWDT